MEDLRAVNPFILFDTIRDREWCQIEQELENNQYLLRDRICDLVSRECWQSD